MKKILILCLAMVFAFSLVSTNAVFSSESGGEKAAQAEEAKKDEPATPAAPEEAKSPEAEESTAPGAAEPEKAEEGDVEEGE